MGRYKDDRDDSSFKPHASVASDWLDKPDYSVSADLRVSVDESTYAGEHRGVGKSNHNNNWSLRPSTVSSVTTTRAEVEALSMNVEKTTKRTWLLAFLVVLIGAAASSAFLVLGITSAQQNASDSFQKRALKVATEIEKSWQDYDMAALWIHSACREWRTNNYTRDDFGLLYQYIRSIPLEFYGMNWVPNVTHAERAQLEEEGKTGWLLSEEEKEEWTGSEVYNSGIAYSGFMGMEPDPNIPGELIYTERAEQPWYFPIQFSEPKAQQLDVAHYDLYSAPWESPAIDRALQTGEPAVTKPFQLVSLDAAPEGYSVVYFHPGPKLDQYKRYQDIRPRDLSAVIVHSYSLLKRATRFHNTGELVKIYLYDKPPAEEVGAEQEGNPTFMAGLEIKPEPDQSEEKTEREQRNTVALPEVPYSSHAANQDKRFLFEQDLAVGGRTWVTVVVPVEGTLESQAPGALVFSGILMFVASLLLAAWMIHNMQQSIRMHRVLNKAAAEAAIVSEMFPSNVRSLVIREAEERNNKTLATKTVNNLENGEEKAPPATTERVNEAGTGDPNEVGSGDPTDDIIEAKQIADLHPYTTVLFSNLCGFTAWASVRTPSQVFHLLEVIFQSFDQLAKQNGVFKVETVADRYIAVTGLPKPREKHAVVMARFAVECSNEVQRIVKSLEQTLGPGTCELGCKFGLHSGQVVAGVLRGDKGRFQLFGDTVIKASMMEATALPNKIQVSAETAELLEAAGKASWLIPRDDSILMNGKPMPTYFLHIARGPKVNYGPSQGRPPETISVENNISRLVKWNVGVLSGFLSGIVARRSVTGLEGQIEAPSAGWRSTRKDGMILDEVKEVIMLPRFDARASRHQATDNRTKLDEEVENQLSNLVSAIADLYRDNPFHSFEHASHCTMSVVKMMERIINPRDIEARRKQQQKRFSNDYRIEAALHDHTFGITSDPLVQFACVFAALIHDLDHPGVENSVLVKENSPLAQKYKGKSVTEQHSVELAWDLLLKPEYDKLRECLCQDDVEIARFRSLVVNTVMATDFLDKELAAARTHRWHKAFSDVDDWAGQQESQQVKINRKATTVIEHLIQASDVSHTMQHWHVFTKWDERLFHETYKAYMEGRIQDDPTYVWYDGELAFFDNYVIPLAKKLFTCGVFGVSSDEFLNYAVNNRKEWAARGEGAIKKYLETYEERYGL